MAYIVSGFEEFESKFYHLKQSRDIFLFLLYDSGGSQEAIANFIRTRFTYLDELAAASKTFIFLFTPHELGNDAARNPGPAVAASFRIRPNQLPGVLIFCLADDNENFGDGAFFPLDESLFEDNPKAIEDAFADLFTLIQESAEVSETPPDQIAFISKSIKKEQRTQELRPLQAAVKAGTISVIQFAGQLLLAVAPAWN